MTDEEIIQQILLKHPEISRNQVLENLKTEKHRTGNLIADTTLLRLVAARYGVETSQVVRRDRSTPIGLALRFAERARDVVSAWLKGQGA